MTKIIDGANAVLGRLASYTAKELLRGEEMIILNCEKVIITGNKQSIKEDFLQKRRRVGTVQKGPKVHKPSEKIVKRAVRGMLPDHRQGRGRDAFKRLKCYSGIPLEFEKKNKIIAGKDKRSKYVEIGKLLK
jgi:large subunit ribosomal protein L13